MIGTAYLSGDGLYRYLLTRDWSTDDQVGPPATVTFALLNSSTADANANDPTVGRCIGFARATGHTRLQIVNPYAFRTARPAELWRAEDPVGPDNDEMLVQVAGQGGLVVAGWGAATPPVAARALHRERIQRVREIFQDDLWCLGVNADGSPKHPLYLPNGLTLMRWPPRPAS